MLELRQSRLHREDRFGGLKVLAMRHADHRLGAAMLQQEFDFGAAIRHMQRLQDRAGITGSEISENELGTIGKLYRNDIAAPDAKRSQPRCQS